MSGEPNVEPRRRSVAEIRDQFKGNSLIETQDVVLKRLLQQSNLSMHRKVLSAEDLKTLQQLKSNEKLNFIKNWIEMSLKGNQSFTEDKGIEFLGSLGISETTVAANQWEEWIGAISSISANMESYHVDDMENSNRQSLTTYEDEEPTPRRKSVSEIRNQFKGTSLIETKEAVYKRILKQSNLLRNRRELTAEDLQAIKFLNSKEKYDFLYSWHVQCTSTSGDGTIFTRESAIEFLHSYGISPSHIADEEWQDWSRAIDAVLVAEAGTRNEESLAIAQLELDDDDIDDTNTYTSTVSVSDLRQQLENSNGGKTPQSTFQEPSSVYIPPPPVQPPPPPRRVSQVSVPPPDHPVVTPPQEEDISVGINVVEGDHAGTGTSYSHGTSTGGHMEQEDGSKSEGGSAGIANTASKEHDGEMHSSPPTLPSLAGGGNNASPQDTMSPLHQHQASNDSSAYDFTHLSVDDMEFDESTITKSSVIKSDTSNSLSKRGTDVHPRVTSMEMTFTPTPSEGEGGGGRRGSNRIAQEKDTSSGCCCIVS